MDDVEEWTRVVITGQIRTLLECSVNVTQWDAGVQEGGGGKVVLYTRMVIGSISTSCRRIMLYISGETLLMAPTAVATATTVEIHPRNTRPTAPAGINRSCYRIKWLPPAITFVVSTYTFVRLYINY